MSAPRSPTSTSTSGGEQDRMLGRVLGDRYRVLSRLGEGGMGTVYLCEHVVLRRRFAVKVLRADLVSDEELADRFRNEAIAASRIGQENVVDVLDFGVDDDGALYYVMEALDGRSLGAVIAEDGPLPVARALDVLEQLCRALGAAHARGVVHRDVKPDNVFLVRRADGGEQVKVIDFGISHVPALDGVSRLTRAGAIIGTPEYMAPEQAIGDPVDLRADVYAAGVLLYEMLTGELPLLAPTPMATIVAHHMRTPEPPSRRMAGIPAGVDALVLRALAKRPEDRFPSMEALAAEAARLRAALDGPTTSPAGAVARPSRPRGETVALPAPEETGAGSRRLRLAAVAIVVVAAALFVLAGGALWQARSVITGRERGAPAEAAAARPGAPTAAAEAPPQPAPSPPVLVEEASAARATAPVPVDDPARTAGPARKAARRPPRAADGAPAGDLKDPYGGAGALKDPFE